MSAIKSFLKYVVTHFSIRNARPDHKDLEAEDIELRWTFFKIPFLRKPKSDKENSEKTDKTT